MRITRSSWLRVPALVACVIGLAIVAVGITGTGVGAKPGNGNPCVTKGNDTDSPPAGCDKSRPGGQSQGKVCPENHPQGKRVPAVDKGLSPDRPHGNAHGGTEVVCATTATTAPSTTTTTDGETPTTLATPTTVGGAGVTSGTAPAAVLGVTVQPGQGVAPAAQTAAVPEELAFTGTSASPKWWLLTGVALMVLGGAVLALLSAPGLARVPARR